MCSLKLKVDPSDTVFMDLTLTFLNDLVWSDWRQGQSHTGLHTSDIHSQVNT
ncbi:hypothetical protein DPMN_111791 [Dreissena polymorpha]|uniref:Uncharacterized protein n=1 Tax=Dreissena polymorpha TaxID=45954 RepID=A0A9D4QQ36_DREPO|nr:hypothetical protein DPMN_111791 [Dreissena polymorpha]